MLRLEVVQECKWEGKLKRWWQRWFTRYVQIHTDGGCYELSLKLFQAIVYRCIIYLIFRCCLPLHNFINAKLVWFIALLCVGFRGFSNPWGVGEVFLTAVRAVCSCSISIFQIIISNESIDFNFFSILDGIQNVFHKLLKTRVSKSLFTVQKTL